VLVEMMLLSLMRMLKKCVEWAGGEEWGVGRVGVGVGVGVRSAWARAWARG
jgi:hypothetical protein